MFALTLALALAQDPGEPGADETRAFMKKLAAYVFENHLKKDEASEQRGMVYEYFDVAKKGKPGQWVQGEALDTMHDGAWFARGLVEAARATGDPYYEEFLTRWVLPFYLKMLNRSDTLFSARQDDSDPKAHRFGREHQLQEGEKGFVPYFWDDGASVSLEAGRKKTGRGAFSCTDRLAGRPNPEMRLSGWSHGSSNHMAQDLGVMLQVSWLLLRDKDPKLSAEIAEAARNLQDCRSRHGAAGIPACLAPAGLAGGDAKLLRRIAEPRSMDPSNHYTRCLAPRDPARAESTPGFADDAEYEYYSGIARAAGELPRALAFRLVYSAYTHPMLIRYAWDDRPVPPGMNRFDLGGLSFKAGKPDAYRSDREIPMGSRFGPQNMIVCGWALQALLEYPGLWEERLRAFPDDLRVRFVEAATTLDGKADAGAAGPVPLGTAAISLLSRRSALVVSGAAAGESVTLRLHSTADAKGPYADVTIRKDRTWEARNDRGDELRISAEAAPADGGFAFEFELPYTVAKGQKPWANGVEHFRYRVDLGEARRTFTLVSSEDEVRRALRRELGQGLRTWERIFAEKGHIPTGIGRWDGYSDSGGYAHLLAAGAQWLHVLDGKRNWRVHHVPRVE